MKIGLFTPVFGSLGVKEMLAKVHSFGRIEAIEIGTGGWPGRDHIDLDLLLTDPAMSREYKQMIADAGLTISALSCHGNPLHPDEDRAKADDEVFKKTVRLAERVDVPSAIRALGSAIFHVHAKDVAMDAENVRVNGVIDTKSYRRMPDRSWLFRTVGWGHDELEWKRIVSALRLVGYDYVMSIEHEDAFASIDEGLKSAVDLLSRVVLSDPPADPW